MGPGFESQRNHKEHYQPVMLFFLKVTEPIRWDVFSYIKTDADMCALHRGRFDLGFQVFGKSQTAPYIL